jgi:hypothetical protein
MNDDGIPQEVVDRMMVKCGRRCCICRHFRPTKLQVHHIHEKAKGGSHDEDNLIVTCFSCHSDVHTKVPFARRFSEAELKAHRDALVKQVADGVLPAADTNDTDEVLRAVVEALRGTAHRTLELTAEAVEILLKAVNAAGGTQGDIHGVPYDGGFAVIAGGQNLVSDMADKRMEAKYKHALHQLLRAGLIEHNGDGLYEVTYPGYLAADEFAVRGSDALAE